MQAQSSALQFLGVCVCSITSLTQICCYGFSAAWAEGLAEVIPQPVSKQHHYDGRESPLRPIVGGLQSSAENEAHDPEAALLLQHL